MDERLQFYLEGIAKLLDQYECDEDGNTIDRIECSILVWNNREPGDFDRYIYDGVQFVKVQAYVNLGNIK